jgi:hypothetical protein
MLSPTAPTLSRPSISRAAGSPDTELARFDVHRYRDVDDGVSGDDLGDRGEHVVERRALAVRFAGANQPPKKEGLLPTVRAAKPASVARRVDHASHTVGNMTGLPG